MPRTGGVYSPPAGTKGVSNTTIQSVPYNAFVDDLTADANDARPVTAGGTGATTASGARTNLGLAIGTNVQAYDALLQSISGLTTSANQMIYMTATDTATVSTITAFGRSLIDDADAAAARTTLSAQESNAALTSIAGLTTSANQTIYTTASNTYATASLTAFGRSLIDDADATAARSTLGVVIGTNVQAFDAGLNAIAALAVTDGNFIVGNGTTWVAESGATVRTSLGLGAMATENSVDNGNWSGTDLAIANGGTGASDAATARTNLGLGGLAVLDTSDLVYTGTSFSNTSFPVGQVLSAVYGGGAPNRNATVSVYLHTSSSDFNTSADGTQLTGTWRAKGTVSAGRVLVQRIS